MRLRPALLLAALAALCAVPAAAARDLPVGSQRISATRRVVAHGTCTLAPTAATYVDQAKKNTNFGSDATVQVSGTTGGARYAFLRFDPSACSFPSGSVLDRAQLVLTVAVAPSASRTFKLYRAGGSWTESGLKWSNQPTVGASLSSAPVGPGATTTSFPVLTEVASLLAGGANDGWQVRDSASTSATVVASYWSDDAGTAPALVIDYAF